MDQSGRILYLNHDSPAPAGGVRAIYYHVYHLVKNGYPAFVVHNQQDFRPSWFEPEVPILYMQNDFRIFPNDIVVIPEDYSTALQALRSINVRKYIFCQNHFYIFKGLQGDTSWEDFGISGVFCSSEIISEFVRSVFGYDEVPIVHYAIPLDVFKPREKRLQVAYMPRKRAAELEFIRNLFRRISKKHKQVDWVVIDKMEEEEVARVLGESAIFLSTSLYEGFGLPPLEAMACGCNVVGFHGYGGLEYATDKNGFWCEEGNIIECSKKLADVVALMVSGDDRISAVKRQALKTTQEYTFERQERELVDFWKRLL